MERDNSKQTHTRQTGTRRQADRGSSAREMGAIEEPNEPSNSYTQLSGLGRAVEILGAIAEKPMRPAEIVAQLGLKWTTAYRTIAYLHERELLARDHDTGLYRIGPRLFFMGSSYVRDLSVLEASRSLLKSAVEATGTTAQIAERHGRRSVVLLAMEADVSIVPQVTIGFHFPLHCGSKGQMLLAHSPPDFLDSYCATPLEALTRHTITEPEVLRARLSEIRNQGFAVTASDIRLTTGSVAAPIRDAEGNVMAALTFITTRTKLLDDRPNLIEAVSHVAATISNEQRGRPYSRRPGTDPLPQVGN